MGKMATLYTSLWKIDFLLEQIATVCFSFLICYMTLEDVQKKSLPQLDLSVLTNLHISKMAAIFPILCNISGLGASIVLILVPTSRF